MIRRWYEVTCDCCGKGLNHYIDIKPTTKMLKEDDIVVHNNHTFCDKECYTKFINKQK